MFLVRYAHTVERGHVISSPIMGVSNHELDHMPAVDHVFKVNFLAKWQCQRLYADNHEVMMNLKCGANLKEARKGEYRISMWSSSCTLPYPFRWIIMFPFWVFSIPKVRDTKERKPSYAFPGYYALIEAWETILPMIWSNELQIIEAEKQSHN